VSHFLGNSEKATELYEQSMDLFREQGDKRRLATCLNNLAMVMCSQGELGRAAKLIEESVALLRELGARGVVSIGLCNLGWIALLQDEIGSPADLYRETLTLSWETGVNPVVQRTLEGLACVAGAKGEAQRAARLWGAAQALHETKGIPRDFDFLAEADALDLTRVGGQTRVSDVKADEGGPHDAGSDTELPARIQTRSRPPCPLLTEQERRTDRQGARRLGQLSA
jgi:tetratricopeptide (TPR) repeat protein